jgi:hypothetical protein
MRMRVQKLQDLESLDSVWYQNHIVWMRDHSIEGIVELDFTFEGRDLCPNGRQRRVSWSCTVDLSLRHPIDFHR